MTKAEKLIQTALGHTFDGLGTVSYVASGEGTPLFAINTPSRSYAVRALWAGAGWPADISRAIRHVEQPWPRDLIVVVRSLSPGSQELLEQRGANWVDETGRAHVIGQDFLVLRDRSSAPGESSIERPDFSWSASAISIAEAILARAWSKGIGTGDLATITGWSPTQVSQTLQAFDANRWTTKWGPQRGPGSRRELADLNGLLSAWAAAVSGQGTDRRFAERSFRDPLRFLRTELGPTLDEHVRWAVTGWAAAQELAPFATVVPSIQVYVDEQDFSGALTQAMREISLTEVDEGGRIEFRRVPSSTFASTSRDGEIPLASAPRVYADLLALGGRGEDIAAHLRDEVIVPLHRSAPSGPPSADLAAWDRACRERLRHRVRTELEESAEAYAHGSWSFSYFAPVPGSPLTLPELKESLEAVAGHETGWPPWWVPTRPDMRPQIRDGGIECWFKDGAVTDPAHADYWRAEPSIRMFLLRGYQEDAITGNPGTTLDLTLPVWRVGECLLHASRLARRHAVPQIRCLVHWTGLAGRELKVVASPERLLTPGRMSSQDEIATYIHATPDDIESRLPSLVQALVSPLYELFDFFVPPLSLYAEELAKMQRAR